MKDVEKRTNTKTRQIAAFAMLPRLQTIDWIHGYVTDFANDDTYPCDLSCKELPELRIVNPVNSVCSLTVPSNARMSTFGPLGPRMIVSSLENSCFL